MVEVSWHVDATQDLGDTGDFIARASPLTAHQFVARIVAAAERLREFPRLGRAVPEIADDTYRECIFQNYRIVYRLVGEQVTILGVIHSAMDMEQQVREREWDLT